MVINTPVRLPRQIEADDRHDAFRAALIARTHRLRPGGTVDR